MHNPNLTYIQICKNFAIIILNIVLLNCDNTQNKPLFTQQNNDSISQNIIKIQDENLEKNEKELIFNKSLVIADNEKDLQQKNKYLLKLAFVAYKDDQDTLFLKINEKARALSHLIRDSLGLAETFWNLGSFYSDKEVLDSSYSYYHRAYELYSYLKKDEHAGKMLYNIALVQKNIKDYTGSEISCIKAIENFKSIENPMNFYRCYNLLGIIYSNLEEYSKSTNSYEVALEYLEKVEEKWTYYETTLNNIGLSYIYQDKVSKAIPFFNRALSNKNLKKNNPNLYSKLLDNLTYARYLNGETKNVQKDFNNALRIRDSLNFNSGIVISSLHLAEYHAKYGDTLSAIEFSKNALKLAKEVNNHRDELESLILLSKLDNINSQQYLKSYIHLNDSLQKYERTIREKFTRIRFETDEYIEKTEKLTFQKTIIVITAITTLAILSLLYFIIIQRSKNKQLKLERDQQQANEEIYKLMLDQQSKLEEGRLNERHRISEELHDGIIGKIYGTRMGLGLLEIDSDNETIETHALYLNDLQHIEKEIRIISHELKNDILLSKTDYLILIEKLLKELCIPADIDYFLIDKNKTDWTSINDNIKMNLYRILQESIQNIVKHSSASNVRVTITHFNEYIETIIEDNGQGFKLNKSKKGIGLRNIESRIKKIHGEFKIKSTIGQGTTLNLKIPNKN